MIIHNPLSKILSLYCLTATTGALRACQYARRFSTSTRGYTLIEILVVVIIISIVGSVAMLSISFNQHTNFKNLADQLSNLITLAKTQAMLQPATLGLKITDNTYQFYEYDTTQLQPVWKPLTDHLFGLHTTAVNTHLSVQVNHRVTNTPQIIISDSGDITPFTLSIGKSLAAPSYQIIGDTSGQIQVFSP